MSAICGIVGERAAAPKGTRDLAIMLGALRSRGPDGSAHHVGRSASSAAKPVALGFRLLRLGADDPAPVVARTDDGVSRAVCDGRVFNASEVREHLRGR